MKVIYDSGQNKKFQFRNPVLAIGIFDGLHLGHQYIIKRTVAEAKRIGGTSIVLTFYPHPNHVLKSEDFSLLVSLKHRLKLIEELRVDVCIIVDFTKRFSSLAAEEFVENFIITKIGPLVVFVGADFTFGKNRTGNVDLLKKIGVQCGFKTIRIAPLRILGKIISSTLIRSLIRKGKLNKASSFLGRPVSILDSVIKGEGLGNTLGFPTANVFCVEQALPPPGVYAVRIISKKIKFLGMAFNLGMLPSFKERKIKANLEVHIFNFRKNIYGQEIEVEFYKKIRAVKKFKKPNSLKEQIGHDAREVKRFFRQFNPTQASA